MCGPRTTKLRNRAYRGQFKVRILDEDDFRASLLPVASSIEEQSACLPSATTTARRLPTSISRRSPAGDQRPSCSAKTRRGELRPSCRSYFAQTKADPPKRPLPAALVSRRPLAQPLLTAMSAGACECLLRG